VNVCFCCVRFRFPYRYQAKRLAREISKMTYSVSSNLTCIAVKTVTIVIVALSWELLYADDLVVQAETEEDLIKRLNEWKDNVENGGMRIDMIKTKVMISGERQKPMQKAARWPCGVCSRGVGSNSIHCTSCQKWVHKKCSDIKGSMYKVMKSFTYGGGLNPATSTGRTSVDIDVSANL